MSGYAEVIIIVWLIAINFRLIRISRKIGI